MTKENKIVLIDDDEIHNFITENFISENWHWMNYIPLQNTQIQIVRM